MDQYPYLVLVLGLGIIWLILFMKRKDLRHEQVVMSFLVTPAALTQIWFYQDYWRPGYIFSYNFFGVPIGVEEFLFIFFMGGIGSVIYEFILNRQCFPGKKNHLIAVSGLVFATGVFFVIKYLGVNTIWASVMAFIAGSILLTYFNKKLLPDLLWSGLAVCGLLFIMYFVWILSFPGIVEELWVQDGLSNLNFLKVPIEEIIWYLAFGMFSGISYESWVNVKKYPLLRVAKLKRLRVF